MPILIVTNNPEDWPFEIPNVDVVDAWSYLTRPEYSELRGAKVFNLCRHYRYQSTGYYASLLAEARGHRPLPSIATLQDLKSQTVLRLVSDDLDELIQKTLARLHSNDFTLSVYFGRNMAKRYERLSLQLFNLFQAPLLRFKFTRILKTKPPSNHGDNGAAVAGEAQLTARSRWQIRGVRAISGSDVPQSHRKFIGLAAAKYFAGRSSVHRKRVQARYDLAILHNPDEAVNAPSNDRALKKFVKAAEALGMDPELIVKDDYGRLAEFDALFIRETTAVNHYTYRFAQRAATEGLVVMDDPQSIARCTNKVFLAELLQRHRLPIPRTIVVHRENVEAIAEELGFPCVLKKPDSAFSMGVVKVESREVLHERLKEFFGESDLLVAQEFLPTTFDWRIAVLDRKPLFACKYFMAPGHWQVIQQAEHGDDRYGKAETLPVELVPRRAVAAALKAANLIGDGLYGVDVKQSDAKFFIIEVNDNPNIDAGVEDVILREELYRRVMSVFLDRIEQRKARSYA